MLGPMASGLEFQRVRKQCADGLAEALVKGPIDWVVVGGSGIGAAFGDGDNLPAGIELEQSFALGDLGLPTPAVLGHSKSLLFTRIAGQRVVLQTGRIHPYEGHEARVCTAALDVVLEKAKALLLTCAVGALDPALRSGQLVCIRDQIGLWGPTPLVGARFIDCGEIYRAALRSLIAQRAQTLGMPPLPEVVYVHARGPQFETPAEVKALRMLGGDVVGMSTTYEAVLGAAHGLPVAGVGLVTNSAGATGLSHEEVQAQGEASRQEILKLMIDLLGQPVP